MRGLLRAVAQGMNAILLLLSGACRRLLWEGGAHGGGSEQEKPSHSSLIKAMLNSAHALANAPPFARAGNELTGCVARSTWKASGSVQGLYLSASASQSGSGSVSASQSESGSASASLSARGVGQLWREGCLLMARLWIAVWQMGLSK